ncbi:MAG: sialate O-acetylesterase [Donghicola eburneus]|nr:sialate O-acetylesterase [Donghicola eburneus]MCI5042302.1 sialate O-acetylesterase [Donghicola eburneus]
MSAALKNTAAGPKFSGFEGRSAQFQQPTRPQTALGAENTCQAGQIQANCTSDGTPLGECGMRILAFGQSNMQGRFGPSDSYMPPNPRVRVWNYKKQVWQTATLGKFPFFQANNCEGAAGNLAYHFSHLIAKYHRRSTDLVLLASDGKRIEFFIEPERLKENGWRCEYRDRVPFGKSMSLHLSGGLAEKAHKLGPYDIVIVHQGEANFKAPADSPKDYQKKLEVLLIQLRDSGVIGSGTKVILGEISQKAPNREKHSFAIKSLSSPNLAISDWGNADLVSNDRLHADGNGLKSLGQSYMEAYLSLLSS